MCVGSNEAVVLHRVIDFLWRRIGLGALGDGYVGGKCGISSEGVGDRIGPARIAWQHPRP